MKMKRLAYWVGVLCLLASSVARGSDAVRPNVVLIYADDLGFGDVNCYGATRVETPNIDRLAREGLRFTDAHSSAATCTPSRYSMLTGEYAWRKEGTGVLSGNAALIIEPGRATLPSILKAAGYRTGVVGKWHLGLGAGDLDWNDEIRPGPLEVGFDTCFLIPATGDRVPCVYVEDHRVVGLEPDDPIQVSYGKPVGDEPTGKEHPELLKVHPSHGHNQTIVNGISRIGYMSGGKSARWVDEDMADVITRKALQFLESNKERPFFLYFSLHDIHVPRVPHPRFVGKTPMGPRGDAIVQADWCTGQIIDALDRLGLAERTLVIFSSDNGPVVDDGYQDEAVEKLGDHKPAGPLRGGKYSAFEGGTRVPFIVRWPGRVRPGVTDALVSQVDLPASLATLVGRKLAVADAPDSFDVLPALLDGGKPGRDHLVEQARTISIRKGSWKLIEPNRGPKINRSTATELGNYPAMQLYRLDEDAAERKNLAAEHPDVVRELNELLAKIRSEGRSRPVATPTEQGAAILKETGVRGGIVVHLGCGDGRLTAALRADASYTVHGLDADPENVAAARRHLRSLGLYGPVSVDAFTGSRLPYEDGLINLAVVEDAGEAPPEEIQRVLAPRGVAYVKTAEGWTTRVKPIPPDTDEWSHFLHDAGNNAVARDSAVGPPRSLQWLAPPLWLRSHETPSGFQAMVSAGGRLFYLLDEGIIGITDQRLPERWALVARDAFNGKHLWRREIDPWGWPQWAKDRFGDKDWTTIVGGRTVVPEENQRRLVASGDRLYATLGYEAPLSILDAASGRTIATLEGTAPVREILASEGLVLALSEESATSPGRRRDGAEDASSTVTVADGATGKVLWTKAIGTVGRMLIAVDEGRVLSHSGGKLRAFSLRTGDELWEAQPAVARPKILVAHEDTVLLRAGMALAAHDGETGGRLWRKTTLQAAGGGGGDLFVVDGVVWPGIVSVNASLEPASKGADALALGFDLRTGEERKRVVVENLRSPEHHHRCYRNKATERYLISSMEGCEFLDIQGESHSQNNWVRGACRYGVMPCNGMLYVPPDQCFCAPGAKVLGFTAVTARDVTGAVGESTTSRLEKGPSFGEALSAPSEPAPDDWPTYRRDPGRHASSPTRVGPELSLRWRVSVGGRLTAPVAVGERVYVASSDAHSVIALDASTGREAWSFVAGGRVDSPPTILGDLVLFGSADGRVYCLRASNGEVVWRFLAAPEDRRIAAFDQLESIWPVHGSVLVRDGLAYVAAGRSTYLNGGIHLYALEPLTGEVRHRAALSGPFPDGENRRDVSFYLLGANSDILVSEGDSIYMRQKRLTPRLEEVQAPVLSSKGEMDVGLHVFSTASLIDGSWYNRTFWMYSKRWPGFQLANQAPKTGQLLVVDERRTYAARVFYRRNVHSPMFFPGKEGVLVFADRNDNEPQIVGEEGAREPVEWLPQSGYARREGTRELGSPAFGLDKMIGYTRAEPPQWARWLPIRVRAMAKGGDTLVVAGPPDVLDPEDPYAALDGRRGGRIATLRADDGAQQWSGELPSPPVFDGIALARGRLLVSLEDGSLECWSARE